MKECDGKLFFSTRTEYKIELNNNKKNKRRTKSYLESDFCIYLIIQFYYGFLLFYFFFLFVFSSVLRMRRMRSCVQLPLLLITWIIELFSRIKINNSFNLVCFCYWRSSSSANKEAVHFAPDQHEMIIETDFGAMSIEGRIAPSLEWTTQALTHSLKVIYANELEIM